MSEQRALFDKLFESNISKIAIGVIVMIWIYTQIIIPLKEMNVQIAQINLQLSDFKAFQSQVAAKNNEQDRRLDSLERE
jgi:hypothetical protein